MAWLSGWAYRKPLVLTGTGDAQTDFQLDIDIAHVVAKMQADFDDIRFTQNDGTTLIDAWLESYVADTSAETWVEFPTTPANTVESDPWYMYYGKDVVNYWDIGATFLFGDDFPGDTLNAQWNDTSGTPVVSGGNLELQNGDHVRASGYSAQYCRCKCRAKKSSTSNGISRVGMSNAAIGSGFYSDDSVLFYKYNTADIKALTSNEGTLTGGDTGINYAANVFQTFELLWKSGEVKVLVDDVLGDTYITNVANESLNPRAEVEVAAATEYIDWYFISKYAANPPTYAFGAEESAPAVGAIMNQFQRHNLGADLYNGALSI